MSSVEPSSLTLQTSEGCSLAAARVPCGGRLHVSAALLAMAGSHVHCLGRQGGNPLFDVQR